MHEIFAQISDFAKQLEGLLRLKGFDEENFLDHISNQFTSDGVSVISYKFSRVSLEQFSRFIKDNYADINPIFGKVDTLKKYVDIDGDGYIDHNDLEVFLKRYQQMEYAKSEITQSVYSFRTDLQKYALFPTKKLGKKKANEILGELR